MAQEAVVISAGPRAEGTGTSVTPKPHLRARIGANAFRGASVTDRAMALWNPWSGSADSDLLPERDALVARSRDLDRNSGIATGGIQTIVDNVVGVGLRLSARPNYLALGKSKEWADEWSNGVEALWADYTETTACDAADALNFDQLTALQFRSELLNGESLALPLWLPDRPDGWATKIQTVEADRLSQPWNKPETSLVRGGIEYDVYGAAVAYWVRKTHPGDFLAGLVGAASGDWERIPKRTPFGRLRVIHCFEKTRSGQSRGKPILSSVLAQFKQIDRFANAEIMAAVLNAMLLGAIETPLEQETIEALFQNNPESYLKSREEHSLQMQEGSLLPLFPGDKLNIAESKRPTSEFGNFMRNVGRIIAVGLDLPYELLFKDFSQSNYSNTRAAMLEAWRSFNRRRDGLGVRWCDPVYGLWLEEAINAGDVDAPDFYANRAAYMRCRWIGPGRGQVDPVKETTAAEMRIENNISTLEDECAEQGRNWREVIDQRRTEREYMVANGFDVNPQRRALTFNDAAPADQNAAATQ